MPDEKKLHVGTYSRTIQTRPVTFTCSDCGRTVTEERYPGPPPTVCTPCYSDPERQRRLARIRKQNQRARERARHE